MPAGQVSINLQAALVIDNNVLSMLADYCCEKLLPGQPVAGRMTYYKQWMGEMLGHLRTNTPDRCLHSSQTVVEEFTPSGTFYAKVQPHERQGLLAHVRGCLSARPMGDCIPHLPALKELPGIPGPLRSKLGRAGELTDNDLSLAVVGASLTQSHPRVYVLTNDQDLLTFISWLRTQSQARRDWPNLGNLQGFHSLVYLENVHRSCKISTQEMQAMIGHIFAQEYQRAQKVGPEKGGHILQTLLSVSANLTDSALHKQRFAYAAFPGEKP